MPTYEYKCKICGYTFERFQNITDGPVTECPACHGKTQRLICGGSAVIIKGSGISATHNKSSPTLSCGRDRPCCGRETPCDKKPCQ